jgi:YebC/PmpR family DNA-binding regulatory protein
VAGHSHWAKIKRQKGATDAKKGKIFSKHVRLILTAARLGGADPDMNPRLRLAMDKARADGMPKENVDRAIRKGTGETGGAAFEPVIYEAYLPGGVACLIDCLTDNRNRTVGELRNILENTGGNLATSGAVQWGFEQRALFRVAAPTIAPLGEEKLLDAALAAGADDLRSAGDEFEVLAAPQRFAEVRDGLAKAGVAVKGAEIAWIPKSSVEVRDAELAKRVLAAIDALEDDDDVQGTTTNFEMSDELVRSLGA